MDFFDSFFKKSLNSLLLNDFLGKIAEKDIFRPALLKGNKSNNKQTKLPLFMLKKISTFCFAKFVMGTRIKWISTDLTLLKNKIRGNEASSHRVFFPKKVP